MRSLIARLKNRLAYSGDGAPPEPAVNLDDELSRIERAEKERVIPTGRLIHQFNFEGLDLRLDRDMTGTYRVTVNEGGHRVYSFDVRCAHQDYPALRDGYGAIIRFLSGPRSLRELPSGEMLKGRYYGTGADVAS